MLQFHRSQVKTCRWYVPTSHFVQQLPLCTACSSAVDVSNVIGGAVTLQVVRGLVCWCVSFTISRLQGSTSLYGMRQNYGPLLARGLTGAASMICYYYGLQLLPLGDTVSMTCGSVCLGLAALSCMHLSASGLRPLHFSSRDHCCTVSQCNPRAPSDRFVSSCCR